MKNQNNLPFPNYLWQIKEPKFMEAIKNINSPSFRGYLIEIKEENEKLKEENQRLKKELSEARYYGSDLNKFMSGLSKEMTVMNIDCLTVKRDSKELRIIESKHPNEKGMKYGQAEVINIILPQMIRKLNEINQDLERKIRNWEFGIYLVTGELPYKELEIINKLNQKKFTLKGKEVIDWLEFKLKI